jgi:hypothetical protein
MLLRHRLRRSLARDMLSEQMPLWREDGTAPERCEREHAPESAAGRLLNIAASAAEAHTEVTGSQDVIYIVLIIGRARCLQSAAGVVTLGGSPRYRHRAMSYPCSWIPGKGAPCRR